MSGTTSCVRAAVAPGSSSRPRWRALETGDIRARHSREAAAASLCGREELERAAQRGRAPPPRSRAATSRSSRSTSRRRNEVCDCAILARRDAVAEPDTTSALESAHEYTRRFWTPWVAPAPYVRSRAPHDRNAGEADPSRGVLVKMGVAGSATRISRSQRLTARCPRRLRSGRTAGVVEEVGPRRTDLVRVRHLVPHLHAAGPAISVGPRAFPRFARRARRQTKPRDAAFRGRRLFALWIPPDHHMARPPSPAPVRVAYSLVKTIRRCRAYAAISAVAVLTVVGAGREHVAVLAAPPPSPWSGLGGFGLASILGAVAGRAPRSRRCTFPPTTAKLAGELCATHLFNNGCGSRFVQK